MPATWTVERTSNPRFPFRIVIEQGGRTVVALRTQAQWPGPGQQIFCLRERELDPDEPLVPLERVPVAHLTRVGRKLTVALDRSTRKRCEILVVEKPRRNGTGSYEQIFFRTESGIRAHRSRSRVELRPPGAAGGDPRPVLRVVIDSTERYPWRFPGADVVRRKLATGDYALLDGERVAAVVERKTFENLLSDIGAIQALHQQLADLASHEAAALVIEADYRDFLDARRLGGHWPPAHLARVLAEVAALHPRLPVIFAGNRKLANDWTAHFFQAVATGRAAPELELPLSVTRAYDPHPRGPGLDAEIRELLLTRLPAPFPFSAVAERFPEVPAARLRRVMTQLKGEGRLTRTGAGRAARWAPAV
jgi:hypothetical protein